MSKKIITDCDGVLLDWCYAYDIWMSEQGYQRQPDTDHSFNQTVRYGISEEDMIDTIKSFKPDLIAASILEDAYEFCGNLLDAVKKNFDIPVVAGGVTPTLSPYVVMEHPSIDMVIQGEGEVALPELCVALKNNKHLSEVPNLWYKEKLSSQITRLKD